ncbi:sensor histidine kinase [Gallibacterium sp. AGMB14963]|uniref:sensor histidine kinase n=1 Tax=Gallibacterium faecale TaxID=3019086 RepID=UPI0022F17030|nr:sensor histidine kinase [Gallibacterium sp. AGMB14963]MDA3979795.1 PhnD/SsuA/transferrin family substrate-binding protein [Gallibacterium sp. AGMB14963]
MRKLAAICRFSLVLLAVIPQLVMAENWKIGVLAQRGESYASQQWQPWIDWLNQQLPQQHFQLVPLQLDELSKDKAKNVDFVLTNQSQFFYLNNSTVRWLATLQSPRQKHSESGKVGSAILVKADSPYHQLTDLKGKTLSAVGANAFGGFLLGYNVLYQAGLEENQDIFFRFSGFPADNTVLWLQQGKVDGAIAPVCILEDLAAEGKVDIRDFRVLASRTNDIGCWSSTDLLPNWSLAAMPQVPESLVKKLMTILLGDIPVDLPQWNAPYSDQQADNILRNLYRHPQQQSLWQDVKYWLVQHKWQLLAGLLFILLNYLWITYQVHRKSKALTQAHHEMRLYERQLMKADRLSILGEMSAGIAHEINQPLTAIGMYSEGLKHQLKQRSDAKKELEILDKIQTQVDRSRQIMRNLTGWVKEKEDEEIQLLELKLHLEKAIDFVNKHYGAQAKIRLICRQKWQVKIKKTMLEQVICNCLLNALQAQADKIVVNVAERQAQIQITLIDNGIGFSDAELEFPFVPFRSRKKEGLGLGLTLCQRLMHSMSGDIHFHNRQDKKGAVVVLELPLEKQ